MSGVSAALAVRRWSFGGLAALISLVCAGSSPAWAQDAGVARVDAGVARADAGIAVVAPGPTVEITPEALNALRVDLRRLTAVSKGAQPKVPLSSLFGIDVEDDAAVKIRIQQLDAQIAQLRAQLPNLDRIDTSSTSSMAASMNPRHVWIALRTKTFARERRFLALEKETRAARALADRTQRAQELEEEAARERAIEAAEEARLAELARIQALQEAEVARTESLKALKQKIASVARARSSLAEFDQRLATRQEEQSVARGKAIDRGELLLKREAALTDPVVAVALFGEIRTELQLALDGLKGALKTLSEPIEVAELDDVQFELPADASEDELEAKAELDKELEAFHAYAAKVRGQQKDLRLSAVESSYAAVSGLADARVRVLAKLPPDVRRSLRGISRLGLSEVELEAELLAISGRAQPVLQADKLQQAPGYLKDVFALGKTFWAFFKIAVIIGLALWVSRRGAAIKEWFDRTIRVRVRSVVWIRRLGVLERAVESYGRYLIFLVALHLVYSALGSLGHAVEIDLLFTTVLWIAYYWLFSAWLESIVLWLAKKRRLKLDKATLDAVNRSARQVGRTVLVYGLLSSVAVRILRPGILYYFAHLALLAGVIFVAVVLLRRWRRPIAHAYLKQWPDGTLARLVETTQDRFYNLVVVVAALVYVIMRGVAVFAKQFVLGFEQSRKALAFVFRKRLERQSEKRGNWQTKIEELPDALVNAFTLEPLAGPELRIAYFPGLDKFERDVERWKAGRSRGSFLLQGGRGYGKTTWMGRALEKQEDLHPVRIVLQRQGVGPGSLLEQLAKGLGLEGEATHARLVEHILQGERRLIAIDDLENIFYRCMGGSTAFDELMDLIEDTGRQAFWLCAVDKHSWRHIACSRPTRIRFRGEEILDDWSETKLRELLMVRASSSGVVHEFEDLVVSGDANGGTQEDLLSAGEGYTRLIWDYADGCPLVALRFWLHSLVPAGDARVRVRLFKEPDTGRLGRIPEEGVFIYAAVANHGALTPEEAAKISRFSEPICEASLVRGVEEGYLEFDEDVSRYRVAVDWQRQMVRFLRARQAL